MSEYVIISLILLGSFINLSISQTYIGPIVGYDFQKVVSSDPYTGDGFNLVKTGFSYSSPFAGLKIQQKIFGPIYFCYIGDYTDKKVEGYYYGGFFQDLIFRYHYFRNQLSLMYLWKNKVFIGIGKAFNLTYNFNIEDLEDPNLVFQTIKNHNESGLIFESGFKYKKYDLELYYYIRTNTRSNKNADFYYNLMHDIYSLGFRLSYNFRILNGINKGKVLQCPDFKKI